MMLDPVTHPAHDHLGVALEETCGALVALELIRSLAGEDGVLRGHAVEGISSLRRAVAELRLAQRAAESFPRGFVLADGGVRSSRLAVSGEST